MIGVIEMRQSYAIEIFFSDEDEGFIPTVPELPGCSAFGETEEEALSEVKVGYRPLARYHPAGGTGDPGTERPGAFTGYSSYIPANS